jgi:TonB family protein
MVAAVLFLLAGGIASYRMGWLPKFGGKSSKSPANKSAFNGRPVLPTPANVQPASGTSGTRAKVDAPGSGSTTVQAAGKIDAPVETPREEVPSEGIAPARASAPAATEKRSAKKNVPGKVAVGESAAIVSKEEDVVVPPKLVKAIRSLSPPEALWKYTSGNVVLDALVNETGHVESATIISGPKALHQRAITTVKDYLYQPATKNGKPVTAHVQVKIQFWYEP